MASKQIAALKGAIAGGDAAACRALLDAEPDLAKDWRAIMEAALFVDLDLIGLLLERGADPNAVSVSEARHRLLHRAIEPKKSVRPRDDRAAAVERLIDAGADVDGLGCWYDGTPLETAARAGDAEVAATLARRGARRDIYAAALLRDPALLDAELARDPALATKPAPSGAGALHLLCASRLSPKNALPMAKRLLDAGAKADALATMRHGRFAVMHFASWGAGADPVLLALLVAEGANPDDGLYEALWNNDLAVAKALIDLGASPNVWSHVGKRPMLHEMIQWGRSGAALWLLDHGADPNATDDKGWTALHFAVSRGVKGALAEKLAAAGGDPTRRNLAGQTPAELAS